MTMNNLALLYEKMGDARSAESLYRQALTSQEKTLGVEHPQTLATVGNLAGMLEEMGDYAAAEPLLKRALAGLEKALARTTLIRSWPSITWHSVRLDG